MSTVDVELSVQSISVELTVQPATVSLELTGVRGATGPTGATGNPGIIVSSTAPVNPTIGQLWVDTS